MAVPLRKALFRWAIALPYVMRSHLLDYAHGSEALEELLTAEEVQWLRTEPDGVSPHRPLRAVGVLMALLQQSSLPPVHAMDISNTMKSYLDHVVTCERIKHTPIPMPYSRCVRMHGAYVPWIRVVPKHACRVYSAGITYACALSAWFVCGSDSAHLCLSIFHRKMRFG